MVQFLDVPAVARLVARVGPVPFLAGLVKYLEQDFRRWPQFEKSARVASHSPNGVIELMPTADETLYAFKYVNGHPANAASGKLTVTGLGVLADVATGYPLLVSEMTLATALRTAATSALAAKFLARPESKTMALIGLGAQSEFQALAFVAATAVRTIRAYDINPAALARFTRNLVGHEITIVAATSVDDAVHRADIITTATAAKKRAAVLHSAQVPFGAHLNAIGGDCPGKTELDASLVARSRLFVEFEPQTRIEGELQQMPPDFAVTELWRVITGEAPGRTSADDVTLFDSVGFAIEDFSMLRYLYDLIRRDGGGVEIDLVPALADPTDLFGVISKL
ncbi:MAG: ornithine cyclodeaminase [Gemmatimonadaceae bacterium]|nr:ornithine cyclodeaminase [Gemmatimonadaceae bacterium]